MRKKGLFSFAKKTLLVVVSLCLSLGCSPLAYALDSSNYTVAKELSISLGAQPQSTSINWSVLRADSEIKCSSSSSSLKFYVADADAHIAMVGKNPDKIKKNYANGINLPAEATSLDVTIPATITDDSGQVWTVKAIGLGALAASNAAKAAVASVTIEAALEYIGPQAFSPAGKTAVTLRLAEGGSIESISASALSAVKGDVVYPDGCQVFGGASDKLGGSLIDRIVYPLSHTGSIWNSVASKPIYVTSPYEVDP